MRENKLCLSYTVMNENQDGKLVFLVDEKREDFIFPITCYEGSYTGLAAVIEVIKEETTLKVDHLELVELTNVVVDEQRLPLFVLSYQTETNNLDDTLSEENKLNWKVFDNLKKIMENYDITGAPSFE